MANFEKKKIDLSSINGGVRYENGDIVTAEAINAPIEACAHLQETIEQANFGQKKYYLHEVVASGSIIDTRYPYLHIYILNTSATKVSSINNLIQYYNGVASIPLFVRFSSTANSQFIAFSNISANYTPIFMGRNGVDTFSLTTISPSGEVVADTLKFYSARVLEYNL